MSIERAIVNCRRCCSLAGLIGEESDENTKHNRLCTPKLWIARNEAMKALEESSVKNGYSLLQQSLARALLETCGSCDYSEPKIEKAFSLYNESKRKLRIEK